jgi:hypothetical protein
MPSRETKREIFTGRTVVAQDLEAAKRAGYEPDGKYYVGRDPRTMSPDELRALGHATMSPMQAIRLKCLECCGQSSDEVRKCVAIACPNWPMRMGKSPWREVSEARREAGRRLAARLHRKSSDPSYQLDASDEDEPKVSPAGGADSVAQAAVIPRPDEEVA